VNTNWSTLVYETKLQCFLSRDEVVRQSYMTKLQVWHES